MICKACGISKVRERRILAMSADARFYNPSSLCEYCFRVTRRGKYQLTLEQMYRKLIDEHGYSIEDAEKWYAWKSSEDEK